MPEVATDATAPAVAAAVWVTVPAALTDVCAVTAAEANSVTRAAVLTEAEGVGVAVPETVIAAPAETDAAAVAAAAPGAVTTPLVEIPAVAEAVAAPVIGAAKNSMALAMKLPAFSFPHVSVCAAPPFCVAEPCHVPLPVWNTPPEESENPVGGVLVPCGLPDWTP
jgi:hypothetical protein